MTIAQYKKELEEFNKDNDNILSPQQESYIKNIIARSYVNGSKDGFLDTVLSLEILSRDVNKDKNIQQLNEQEYSKFYDWLENENILVKYRENYYQEVENYIFDIVNSDDVVIEELEERIVRLIVDDYFNQ